MGEMGKIVQQNWSSVKIAAFIKHG